METLTEFIRNLVNLFAFINLDRLFSRVEHDAAMLASGGMGTNLFEELGAELLVEVVG
jgi:hypothetical protein